MSKQQVRLKLYSRRLERFRVLFWCWLRGHHWKLLRVNEDRASALMHLHTYAGCDADCLRCGTQWRDAEP